MEWRWRGILAALAAVTVTAVAGGCGDSESDPPPFTASYSQVRAECLMGTYLPEEVGSRVAQRPAPRDWSRIEGAPGAFQPDRALVQVTLRPRRPDAEITLTGISFDVVHHSLRPSGIVFDRPCRREVTGPAIEADLDGAPTLGDSSAALDGRIGPGLQVPQSRPISFPWTISLQKPLRLYLLVHAEHSYTSWGARIGWKSDSGEGTIRVDDGGRKFRITDTVAIRWLRPGAGERWVDEQPPGYTNAE